MSSEFITEILICLLIPLLGTSLGSAAVFLMKGELSQKTQKILSGFAAGMMTSALIFSLLLPSLEYSEPMGTWSFVPAVGGIWLGILFFIGLDLLIPHIHAGIGDREGPKTRMSKAMMMFLGISLHNLPEGMAVGIVFAGVLSGSQMITISSAIALAVGIGLQNIPEGAIISLPLANEGRSRAKAFWFGVLSGAIEPLGSLIAILASSLILPAMPWFLSFAAGAMIYAVVDELIPEMAAGEHSDWGIISFAFGFTMMIVLEAVL